ncbi:MAG TPA: hypothetical protein DEA08_14705, partial [Planctomycetes bacterium]|nr:hypothetical protein [Planctomycetota bacterium]
MLGRTADPLRHPPPVPGPRRAPPPQRAPRPARRVPARGRALLPARPDPPGRLRPRAARRCRVSVEDEEFQEFLEIFQEESLDRLRNCSRALDAIQAEEGERGEHLDEVDRELHTIKGSARLLGFSELATLVHELEGLARAFREQPAVGLELLIEASDRLSALVEQASETGEDVTDLDLMERAKVAAQGPAPAPEPLLTNVPASEPPVLAEEVLPDPT